MHKPYADGRVGMDDNGFPLCCHDGKFCDVKECRYYVDMFDVGNCVLRIDHECTLEEVGMVLGVTRERIRQVQDRILEKAKRKFLAVLSKLNES